jgi:hypothetical protein
MSFQYDSNSQAQFNENGNGGIPQGPQGIVQQQPPQGLQQQQQQETGSPAPFAQQGGVEGSSGSVTGDAKTTLWYVHYPLFLPLYYT